MFVVIYCAQNGGKLKCITACLLMLFLTLISTRFVGLFDKNK